jgi:diaminohydroxyphosphoribosylaminopyrimidine deaminase/5-amino-6-(5-phosphoribosylamino)uracil reductase
VETATEPAIAAASDTDRRLMARAVELGRRGWGRTHQPRAAADDPNPLVGCVLARDGVVISEGWHADYGGPHAEVAALALAGEAARGATAYVSLEPCRHQGKTPPCTAALLKAGVGRVVYGARDHGPKSGGGAEVLRAAGVEIAGPLLSSTEARRENPVFFHREVERPWVSVKLALSMDGKISERPGVQTWISGPEADEEVHWLRAGFDAVMVGAATALVDDPLLTVRGRVTPRVPPRRVILDAAGQLSPGARLLREGEGQVYVVTTPSSPASWRAEIESRGARVLEVPAEAESRVSLPDALRRLRAEGVRSVLCEGGGRLTSALMGLGLLDRLYVILVPRLLGDEGVPGFPGAPTFGQGSWTFVEDPRRMGNDVWMVLEPELP